MSKFIWVDSGRKLQSAEKDINASKLIGIDTEYDSFRYFREKLCLIQIKTDHKTYLFDPLNHIDMSFLAAPFSDAAVPKIFHAGDNDIRLLNRDFQFEFRAVFDTQKAASLLGCKHLSLASVIQEILGIEWLKTKHIQRSQWDMRPLSEEQKKYAAQDIEYLLPLYVKLSRDLEKVGLQAAAEQAFKEIAAVKWNERTYDTCAFFKINGFQELRGRQKDRLKRLHAWRFKTAKATDTAVFMILSDRNLIDLARLQVHTVDQLEKSCLLREGKIQKFGAEIIGILQTTNSGDYRRTQAGCKSPAEKAYATKGAS